MKAPTPPSSLKKAKRGGGGGSGSVGDGKNKHSLIYNHDPPASNGSQRNKDICLGFVAFISLLTFCLLIYTLVELHSLSVHQETLKGDLERLKLSADVLRKSVQRQGVDYNLINLEEAALR